MQESQWVVASSLEMFPLIERQRCLCAVGDVEEPRLTACLIVESATVLAVDEGKTALPVHAKRAKHRAPQLLDTNVKKVLMVQNPPPVTAEEEAWNTFKQLAEICETLTIPPEQYREIPEAVKPYFDQVTSLLDRISGVEEEGQDQSLRSAPRVTKTTYVIIRSPATPMVEDRVPGRPHPTDLEPEGDPSPTAGTKLPEHGLVPSSSESDQWQPAPKKGVIYEKGQERYNREALQAAAETLVPLLHNAIQNPDDPLSPAAIQALGSFAEAVEKRKGISARAASREFNVPTNFFLRWAKKFDAIPILAEGTGQGSAVILDREKAQRAADLYHEAKQQGIQPKKLLEALENVDHEHRQAAEQAVQGFARAVEQPEGSSLTPDQTSQEPLAGSGIIYDRGRLTTIAEAARITGKKQGTIYNLLNDGKLTVRGRIFFPARGGGKVLIDLDELDSIPKKPGGRPRKNPKRLLNKRSRGRPRKNPEVPKPPPQRQEGLEQLSTKSSERLMTLAEASVISGIPVGTLANYLSDGMLQRRGRQRSPAPGGGKVLVDQDEVMALQKRSVGRPRKNPITG